MVMKAVNLGNEKIPTSNYALNRIVAPSLPMKINLNGNNSISSISTKFGKQNKSNDLSSPYLNSAKVQIVSQMTEKKYIHKKPTDISSSFSQAYKIYKTSSDEFKSLRSKNKKDKLSQLTVSKEPNNIQQVVSDMNDSEYHNRVDTNRRCKRKRRPAKNFSRPNLENKKFEFYNGDLMCYTQSPNQIPTMKTDRNTFNQDKKNTCKTPKIKRKRKTKDNTRPSDVWAVLRSMNRFQYISSPALSEDSVETIKRKGNFMKNKKDTGLIETCTTEEFSYISSYDLNSDSQCIFSKPTSFDRITIISKKEDLQLQELLKHSVANVLNPRISNKKANKRKRSLESNANKERHNFNHNGKSSDLNKKENNSPKLLDNHGSSVLKKRSSKELLYKHSDMNDDNEDFLLGNDLNSKVKDISENNSFKFNSKEFNQREISLDTYKFQGMNECLSCKSSEAGLNCINHIKVSDKTRIKEDNTGEYFATEKRRLPKHFLNDQIQKLSPTFPKFTETEIRRRLIKFKFPIVILGKDQISSTFRVVDYEHPQFNGLSQQMWPYMTEWSNTKDMLFQNNIKPLGSRRDKNISDTNIVHDNNYSKKSNYNYLRKSTGNVTHCTSKEKNIVKDVYPTNGDINTKTVEPQRRKVLDHFKNKMMDLIYSKSQKSMVTKNIIKCNSNNQVLSNRPNTLKLVKNNPGIKTHSHSLENNINKELTGNALLGNKNQPSIKYPWAKAKWASDFIDNIIQKIKKGMYYTHNEVCNENIICEPQVLVETVPECDNFSEELLAKDTVNTIIPGFDDIHNIIPLKLEVKMITRTLISIHHTLTNVMLQFDITIPAGSEYTLTSSLPTFSPIMNPEHKSMLYKCKSRIPNEILPAELCSILPKLISQIMSNRKELNLEVSGGHDFCFQADTEENQIDNSDSIIESHLKVKHLMIGKFSTETLLKNVMKIHDINSDMYQMKNTLLPVIELKPLLNFTCLYKLHVINLNTEKSEINRNHKITMEPIQNKCMALVPYIPPSPHSTRKLELSMNGLEKYISINCFNLGVSPWKTKTIFAENYSHISNHGSLERPLNPTAKCILTMSLSNLTHKPIKQHSYLVETKTPKNHKTGQDVIKKCVKKTFVKGRKKCKSMTNMSRESCSTALNKITNLDDFFYAIGCGKPLSKVLQGISGRTILSSIAEMKNWIKEITQAQALLVLLLANKKETINLKRFRPMLLQGIAVNRITTAAELDMEVEVIETENLCISQNEGLSFLSQPNDNNLLDELCWIAKTTASDYQKTFDDSSEKLLKSLLGKRKRLSPSYLRVMARYVGLANLWNDWIDFDEGEKRVDSLTT